MKPFITAQSGSKSGRPATSQTPNALPNIVGRNISGVSPALTSGGGVAPSVRIPARGHQDSVLMLSQLG
jgi:hypothetical protein